MLMSQLICHPASAVQTIYQLTVMALLQEDGSIQLNYQVVGDTSQLLVPSQQPSLAVDGLWQHTCFEAFVSLDETTCYHEFNCSPSTQWAAYAFSTTRERDEWATPQPLLIAAEQTEQQLSLSAVIPAANLPANPSNKPWRLGISVILETLTGQLSYWALHHPALCPDFHDPASFVLSLEHT